MSKTIIEYNNNFYGYPKLNPSGLGNLLWIWGRCFLWCKDYKLPVIAPNWIQFHPLRFIRLDSDLRIYNGYFTNKGYIKGWRKYYLLLKSRIIQIERYNVIPSELSRKKPIIFIFTNMNNFTPFIGRQKEIYCELFRIINPRCLPIRKSQSPFIAIHIRRGYFLKGSTEEFTNRKNKFTNSTRLVYSCFESTKK